MNDRARARGQAMTEFALVFPIFALLLFGIIDLGRFVYTGNALNNGAREGARFATVAIRPAECSGLTREQCAIDLATNRSWGVPAEVVTAEVNCRRVAPDGTLGSPLGDPNQCRTNDIFQVTTRTEFNLITPLISQFIGDRTITGDAQMVVNQ